MALYKGIWDPKSRVRNIKDAHLKSCRYLLIHILVAVVAGTRGFHPCAVELGISACVRRAPSISFLRTVSAYHRSFPRNILQGETG